MNAIDIALRIERSLNRRTNSRYSVQLSNVGNPDHRQDPSGPLYDTVVGWARVDSLEEAVEMCQLYLTYYDLGSGNWNGGMVTNGDGLIIARVSSNGRLWAEPSGEEIPINGQKTAAQHEAEGWKDYR
jgi:hypothetical protein